MKQIDFDDQVSNQTGHDDVISEQVNNGTAKTEPILFTCPNCKKEYTLDAFLKHNTQPLNDLIKERTDLEITRKEALIRQDEKERQEQETRIRLNGLEKLHQAALQKKLDEVNELTRKLEQQKAEETLNFTNKQHQIESSFSAKVKDLEAKIHELTQAVKTEKELGAAKLVTEENKTKQAQQAINDEVAKWKKELEQQKANQVLLLENQRQTVAAEFANQVNQQKSEIQKLLLEQKQQQELAKANLVAEKDKLEQAKQTEVKVLQEKLAALEKETANQVRLAVQKQTLDFDQKIAQLEKEKNALDLANQTNRLINNKVKGENFEHEVEGELRKAFGFVDDIQKITEGEQKADYLQIVRNQEKHELGKIVYEVKNAEWKDSWEEKLVVDTAKQKAKYGILVGVHFNDKYHDVPFVKSPQNDHIYFTDPNSFVFVAQILRKLIENESYYTHKIKELGQDSQNKVFAQYKQQHDLLEEFLVQKLPEFKKKFDHQLEEIQKVGRNLNRHAESLDHVYQSLTKEYRKRIQDELQKISTI